MGLRETALADVKRILNDSVHGAGQSLTLIAPNGTETPIVGFTGDIARALDPQTGLAIKGRKVHVTVAMADLPAGARPEGVTNDTRKPWRVKFTSITTGATSYFKVYETDPDDSLGSMNLMLEAWKGV